MKGNAFPFMARFPCQRMNALRSNHYSEKTIMTKIIIDAMGGDYSPKQQVLGCVEALRKDTDLYLILCGDETQIKAELSALKARLN